MRTDPVRCTGKRRALEGIPYYVLEDPGYADSAEIPV